MQPMLNTAVRAARRAATIINRASFDLEQIQVEQKAPNDYVTKVDKAAEEAIIDVLMSAYPTHAVLAEESGGSNNLNDQFHAPVPGVLYFDCPSTEGSHDASRYL